MVEKIDWDEMPGCCCFAIIFGLGSERTEDREDSFISCMDQIMMDEYGGVFVTLNPFQTDSWERFLLNQGFLPVVDHIFNPHTYNEVRVYFLNLDAEEETLHNIDPDDFDGDCEVYRLNEVRFPNKKK